MNWISILIAICVALQVHCGIKTSSFKTKKPFTSRYALQFIEDELNEEEIPPVKINNGDESTITFKLLDVDEEEMSTYIKCRFSSDPDVEKIMLLDISSYMTVLFHHDPIEATTSITYRDRKYDANMQNEEIVLNGYSGPYNQRNPPMKEYKMSLDVGHIVLKGDEKRRFNHDGIIGLASVTNEIDNYLFTRALLLNGHIKSESFKFNEVYLNTTSEIYESSITFGFTEILSDSVYLFTNNTLPTLLDSDIAENIIYRPVLMDVGLSEVDILNYFDITDFERNETVVIDSAVPFLQLPESTLEYFDETFFNDNCIKSSTFDEASCGCVGSDYGGLPTIDFRFKDYLKYSIEPADYMSPPKINATTREPYCRLGIYNKWKDQYPKNAGLGKIFINKYTMFMSTNREEGIITVGFRRGESYQSFSLIVPTMIYYFLVIIVLCSLAIWLSFKKYKRLQEERRKKNKLLNNDNKLEGIKSVSKTLRKMDFNMHMSAYNKVFERQRANTVTN